MKKAPGGLVILLFVQAFVTAQIVTIEPAFFTIEDEITITFDATKGSRGLENVNQVYAHTGVITQSGGAANWQFVQGNWGADDVKVKMTNIGENKHQLTIDIRQFYGLNNISDVTELAFVFRNIDGSKEGKTTSGGDIFITIPEITSFDAFFQSPTGRQLVVEQGESFDIDIVTSVSSRIAIYDNEILIGEENGVTKLETSYWPTTRGNHVLRFEATSGNFSKTDIFTFVYDPDVQVANMPEGLEYGLNYDAQEKIASLAIYAPFKEHVFVIGNFNNFQLQNDWLMNRSEDGFDWWIEVPLDNDEELLYQYFVDGNLKIADPLSTIILDPIHDQGLPNGTMLPEYPRELTDGHLSYYSNSQELEPTPVFDEPQKEDLVIYELLLRDFLGSHSFKDLKDTLSYLKELGINAIELMPIQEFEANDSWGYNPSYHMALDKYYGSPEEFQELVVEAHNHGMAVILDVVYNHAFGQSPLVQLYWDQQLNRPSAESPYFNPISKHPFNVGYDFNHESEATKNYVKQTLKYWIDKFNIDGFRFDLSKGFTQNYSSNDLDMSAYDASRISTLTEYAKFIWSIDEKQYVILEHFATNEEELELANSGMMLWGNGNYNFNEATMGYHEDGKSDFSGQSYKDRGWNAPHVVGYMESHDEERLMYKNLQFGNSDGSYNVKNLEVALKRNAMAAVFFFSIPGPKMLWQFGELGYDYSINRCTNGNVNDCRLDRKPIRWDYQNDESRRLLLETYRTMIAFKTQDPLFKTTDFRPLLGQEVKVIYLNSAEGNGLVIGNFDIKAWEVGVDFVKNGIWHDALSSDSINVTNGHYDFVLEPGEYHLFLDDKFVSTSVTDLKDLGANISLYPNPTEDMITIDIQELVDTPIQFEILDQIGRTIQSGSFSSSMEYGVNIQDLRPGHYFVKLNSTEGQSIVPFIKL